MGKKKITIQRKNDLDNGYKVISIRIKQDKVKELDRIADESNRSRNELIIMFLDHCIQNYEIID